MSGDKRKFKREEVFNKVLVNGESFGYINDVSLGGIKISIMKFEPTEFKDKVFIKILSKQIIGENINLVCVIRWKREEGMFIGYGLEFEELTEADLEHLKKYIDYIKSFDSDESEIIVELEEI